MKRLSVVAGLFAAFLGVSCAGGAAATDAGPSTPAATPTGAAAAVGAPAPGFSLADQTGKKISLSDFAGKIVVLEWINPDCPFVQRHARAKTMFTLASKYKDQGVVWIGINSTKYMNTENNAKWIADLSLPYIVLDDHSGQVGHSYGAKTTPHMFIIDKNGTLAYQGAIDDDPRGDGGNGVNYVDRALGELLAGKPVSNPQTKPYGCSVKYAE